MHRAPVQGPIARRIRPFSFPLSCKPGSSITGPMASRLFEVGAEDVLYVVDLSSYLLRAYHAVAPLSSPSGEPTHAVHGTVTMLERLFRERKPHLLSICMDAGRVTFRKDIYPEYKANRPAAPDDLRVQIKRSEDIVRAWGVSVLKQEGVEADDLIASAVRRARELSLRVVIVSADKDLMQLVGKDVLMWDTLRNKVFGEEEVKERFGVGPELLGDLLALTGDSSDNIPGVPSVGPKTAATLLVEHGSLENILSSLAAIKRKKLKEVLSLHQENARLSRKLVELKHDCDVGRAPDSWIFSPERQRDVQVLREIYTELGFTRQLAQLKDLAQSKDLAQLKDQAEPEAALPSPPHSAPINRVAPIKSDPTLNICVNTAELAAALTKLTGQDIALELFTLRPDHHSGPLIGLGLTSAETHLYIPFEHRYVGAPAQLEKADTLPRVMTTLKSCNVCVHDLKRTLVLLEQASARGDLDQVHDTLLGSYLLDPDRNHGLVQVGASVEREVPEYDSFAKEGRQKRNWDELETEPAATFARTRGVAILEAATLQKSQLEQSGLHDLLRDLEMPLARLLAELELRGVLIDTEALKVLGADCTQQLAVLEKQAFSIAQKEFNVNSPRQLETILFDELGLKPLKRTKTSRSTDAQTLEALATEHELPDVILQIRQIAKLKGTYIDALPALLNKKSGRIHGAWEQAVAATGRISSTDPNLQNIPIRTELGRKIRAAFLAPPGHLIVSADYSQIELRVLAHLSQDERLVEAFQAGQDVHTRTAMEIFEVEEAEVTREMRTRAKAVNFGVIYGQGESGLAKAVGIDRKDAAHFIATYFRRYDGVRTFMNETLEQARNGHAVYSMLGRRRVIPDIKSGNRARRLAAERIAMNMPIQGSAADILKLAMLKLATPVTAGTKMVLTVHDELVFEVPDDEVTEAMQKIQAAMESAYSLSVPLTVEVKSGPNWNVAH